jgi:TetR/AcrR family transcriptional repressor of nem operon
MSLEAGLLPVSCDAMMVIMRYPEGHKQAVRETIVRAAAKALRENGISGVGIPALMKAAGLTHGGFYTHFRDRDALVEEAIRAAASETSSGVFSEAKTLGETLALYLSLAHVEHPEQGCVVAALAAESPRQPKAVRRVFAEAVRGLIAHVDKKLYGKAMRTASDAALRLTATMVGAVVLARAVDDSQLAERILKVARRSVEP